MYVLIFIYKLERNRESLHTNLRFCGTVKIDRDNANCAVSRA